MKKKWDESTIDDAYASLLDSIGLILDKLTLSGCSLIFKRVSSLRFYLKLLKMMEIELLIQWKIKQEKGLELLFVRQRKWLSRELRKSGGFFDSWNSFCREIWKTMEDPAELLNHNPWKSLLLKMLTDFDTFQDFRGGILGDNRLSIVRQITDLFKRLYEVCPHHQVLSFLNLIEIGANYRPDINPLGKINTELRHISVPSVFQQAFSDVIDKDNWDGLPEKLLEFWQSNSEKGNR